jgi:hypothetical protein
MNEWTFLSFSALTLLLSVLLDLKICKIINIFDIVLYSMYITFDLVSNRHYLPFDIKSHSAFITIDIISVGLYFRHFSTFCPIQRLLLLTLWPYCTFCITPFRRCFLFEVFSVDHLSHSTFRPFNVFYRRRFQFDVLPVNGLSTYLGWSVMPGATCLIFQRAAADACLTPLVKYSVELQRMHAWHHWSRILFSCSGSMPGATCPIFNLVEERDAGRDRIIPLHTIVLCKTT